jgi:hypothetical protein
MRKVRVANVGKGKMRLNVFRSNQHIYGQVRARVTEGGGSGEVISSSSADIRGLEEEGGGIFQQRLALFLSAWGCGACGGWLFGLRLFLAGGLVGYTYIIIFVQLLRRWRLYLGASWLWLLFGCGSRALHV